MLISTHGHDSSSAAQNMLTPGAQRVSGMSAVVSRRRCASASGRRGARARLLTDGLAEAARGADEDLLGDAVPIVLLQQLPVHACEGARLLELEERARGRADEVLATRGTGGISASRAHRRCYLKINENKKMKFKKK